MRGCPHGHYLDCICDKIQLIRYKEFYLRKGKDPNPNPHLAYSLHFISKQVLGNTEVSSRNHDGYRAN